MHYTRWMPPFAESKWVVAGVEKFGRYARRKGWLEEGDVVAAEGRVVRGRMGNGDRGLEKEEKDKKKRWWQGRLGIRKMWQKRDTLWGRGEDGVRLLVEVATAWAVVKALIIPRLALSVWATPWFARIAVEPIMRVLARRGSKLVSGSKRKIS